jgi:hypothetical protein
MDEAGRRVARGLVHDVDDDGQGAEEQGATAWVNAPKSVK